MSRNTPTNTDDMIDLDDVRERIEELESERSDLTDNVVSADAELAAAEPGSTDADACAEAVVDAVDALAEWDHDNGPELKDLTDFMSEADGLDGPMIRESYFQMHAMELADDCGLIPKDAGWPCTCIDWEQAASELQHDYTGADFNGVTYYGR